MKYMIKFVWDRLYSSTVLYLLFVLLLYGCVPKSMSMSKQDVQRLKFSEGVVIGSVLVKTGHPDKPPGFLLKRNAEEIRHVFFARKYEATIGDEYQVIALLGEEKIFVTKLKEGEYKFYQISPYEKWGYIQFGSLHAKIHVRFVVAPGKTTYIGKLIMNIPEKIYTGCPFSIEVEDAQDSTIEAIKEEFAAEVKEVTKDLMRIQR